jgi:hypothetical protein
VPEPTRAEKGAPEIDVLQPIEGEVPSLGREVVLRNGLRVLVKHTDLFEDEIIVKACRWGGLTEHMGNGFFSKGIVSTEAQVCSMSAMMLGICGLSVESLQECLDGRRVEPSPPDLQAYSTGFDASASPADFETLLILLHLLFVCPVEPKEKSRGRLSLVKLGLLAWRLGEDRDPQTKFRRRVMKLITGNHPYTRTTSLWSILRLNFRKASFIFNERASRPCEWTFVLVGKLPNVEVLLPLLDTYLGSIPNVDRSGPQSSPAVALERTERQRDFEGRSAVTPLTVAFPERSVREVVHLEMIDPKGSTVICFPVELASIAEASSLQSAEAELKDLFRLRILVRLLETRLIEVLRFKRGQVYGVSVGDDFSMASPHFGCVRKGTLSITFECDPAESDELVAATQEELTKLRSGETAFTEENVNSAREQDRREFEEMFRKNDWWAGTLTELYFSRCNAVSEDIGTSLSVWWRARADVVNNVNGEKALEALRAFLPATAACAVVTMRPKKRRWPFGGNASANKSNDAITSSTGTEAERS